MTDRQKPKETRKLFLKHIVRKLFLEDWAMKLIALVITLGLWFGVTGLSTPTTKGFRVPLNLSISNDTEITNAPQQEVDIVIRGDKRKVDRINKADLNASIDLTYVPPGDHLISLTPETVSVVLQQGMQGITVDEILPSRIVVKLEAVEEKEVEVRAQTTGNPAAGFEVYVTVVQPQRIRVRGPASFINTLDFVETESIDLSDRDGEFTAKQVPVTVANPKAVVFNNFVDVYVRIGERRMERSFSIAVPGSPGRIASFTIYGPRTLLARARADAFKVELLNSENGASTPQLILPPELRNFVEVRRLKLKS